MPGVCVLYTTQHVILVIRNHVTVFGNSTYVCVRYVVRIYHAAGVFQDDRGLYSAPKVLGVNDRIKQKKKTTRHQGRDRSQMYLFNILALEQLCHRVMTKWQQRV